MSNPYIAYLERLMEMVNEHQDNEICGNCGERYSWHYTFPDGKMHCTDGFHFYPTGVIES